MSSDIREQLALLVTPIRIQDANKEERPILAGYVIADRILDQFNITPKN